MDVFFVISGYLITSAIHHEQQAGTFSFLRFFERRLRRIAPALFVAMTGTILIGSWRLFPHEMVELGRSVRAATLSFANIHFRGVADDYFNSAVDSMPLLHTWSLSVEEQFYFLHPVLLLAVGRISRSPWAGKTAVAVAAAASFVASCLVLGRDQSSCFYLLPYRGWELLLGALLAFRRPDTEVRPARECWCMRLAPPLGLVLIVAAMSGYHKDILFPGPTALLPCVGAILVILGGMKRGEPDFVFRLLASKPLVSIGVISYSVYLWHWPLIVFTREFETRSRLWGASVVIASLFVGFVSWRYVERPFRRRGTPPVLALVASWVVLTCLFLGFTRYIRKRDGFLVPPGAEVVQILAYQKETNPFLMLAFDRHVPPDRPFVYGATNVVPKYALWGDSHANAIASVMGEVARRHGQAFKFYGRGGTKPLLGVYSSRYGSPSDQERDYTTTAFTNIVADADITTVVLCARWVSAIKGESVDGPDEPVVWTPFRDRSQENVSRFLRACLDDTIHQLNRAGKRVVVFYPIPELGVNGPQAVAAGYLHPDRSLRIPDAEAFFRRQRPVMEMFDELEPSDQLIRVRPYKLFLADGKIVYKEGLVPFYQDDHHLNLVGARRLIPIFDQLFDATLVDDAH